MPRLVDSTLVLLREESACQQSTTDDEIDDDDVVHDEELMDAVSDLLPAFAKSMGPHFAPIFATLFEPLMKFAVGCNKLYSIFSCMTLLAFSYSRFFTNLTIGIFRELRVHCKIGQWSLPALLKLLKTWVLQLQDILMYIYQTFICINF